MDRFGVFVDAGYLFSASGRVLYGLTDRRRIALDTRRLIAALVALAATDSGREHLRTYWYDGARDLVPTADQAQVASLSNVKLRLGRLTAAGQKGVDSRIVRDLITLSMERAITDAYLLGGDEDLREGVCEAQEKGVEVTLVGVESLGERSISQALAMDADLVIILDREFLQPYVSLRQADLIPLVDPVDPRDPEALGRAYAVAYVERNGPGTVAELANGRAESIPIEVDRQLLSCACKVLRVARLDNEQRSALRAGFRRGIAGLRRTGGGAGGP
jgi:uncharacterized LabA/DUF88 family protein